MGPVTIPRILHQMWVGPPMPPEMAEWRQKWLELHPGWEHHLWTDETLPPLINRSLYDAAPQLAPVGTGQFRADIARYELLWRYGGVWADLDSEPLRPIDPLLEDCTAFAGWEEPGVWVNNAVMGAEPGHSLIAALIDGLPDNVAAKAGRRPNHLSGPRYLTRVLQGHQQLAGGSVTVYPKGYFYAYSWADVDHVPVDQAAAMFPDAWVLHHWNNARSNPARRTSRVPQSNQTRRPTRARRS